MTPTFTGVYPILATPFGEDERLDLASMERMVDFISGLGVEGITVLGVLGESNRLMDNEREEVIRVSAKAARGRCAVIAGTSHSGTQAALALSTMAQKLGADAVMVTPHNEPAPNDERVLEYYRAIAQGIGIPVVLQDHPASTQVHMSVPLILRIVNEVPGIAALKEEAVPTPPKIRALKQGMKTRQIPILTGLGALYGQFDLEAGSDGFNTGFAFPEVLMAMVAAAKAGDWNRVKALYTRFLPLIVFEQQPGAAVRKEILRLRGWIKSNRVRHPGAALAPATAEQLHTLIEQVLPGADLTKRLDPHL